MNLEKRWIILSDNGEFVGIDSSSGGYFYLTDFWDCKKFKSFDEAKKYANINWGSLRKHDWHIYAIDEINPRFHSTFHIMKKDPYEVELAALKKKYNRN